MFEYTDSLSQDEITELSVFKNHLLDNQKYKVIDVTTGDAVKYQGDLEGLIKSKGINRKWLPMVLLLNNLSNTGDLTMNTYTLKIPDPDECTRLLSIINN